MNTAVIKNLLFTTALCAVLGVSCTPQPAHATRCAESDLNCQVAQANAQWAEENGTTPRNLSAQEEAEIWDYLKAHYPNQDFNNHTLTIN